MCNNKGVCIFGVLWEEQQQEKAPYINSKLRWKLRYL